MKEERTGLLKGTILGEYVRIRCGNCGEWKSTFTHEKYFAVDCDCTLWEGKGRFRTTNLP